MQIASGLEQDLSSSAERFGRSHWVKVLLATCAGKTRLLLSHPCFTSNIYEIHVSSKCTFSQGYGNKPGSNVMSFSGYVLNWSILTARKHMDLAVWLMTQQTRPTSGSAIEMGHFLSVKSTLVTFLFYDTFFLVLLKKYLIVVRFTEVSSLFQHL